MRSDSLFANQLDLNLRDVLTSLFLFLCLIVVIERNMELNCRYLSFNTRLNTLSVPTKARRTVNLYNFLLLMSYFLIFDYYFIVFLPYEFWKPHPDTRRIQNKSVSFLRVFHRTFARFMSGTCYNLYHFGYINLVCFCLYRPENLAIWICLMRLVLCPDIHPNPGPAHSNHLAGFFYLFVTGTLTPLVKMISLV